MEHTAIRHQLHRLAELSGCEFKTRDFIINRLKEFSPDKIHTFDDCNSIVAEYDFSENGKTTLLRADFAALLFEKRELFGNAKHDCSMPVMAAFVRYSLIFRRIWQI